MRILLKNVIYPSFENGTVKLNKGDILIENNIIYAVGKNLREFYDVKFDFNYRAFVSPGFVNSHTHPKIEIIRSISPGEPWKSLRNKIHLVENLLSKEEFNLISLYHSINQLKFGVTTMFAVSSFFDEVIYGLEISPIRKIVFSIPKDIWLGEKKEIVMREDIKDIERHFEEFKDYENVLLRTGIGLAALSGASDDLIELVMKFSEKYNKLVQVHVSQSETDVKTTKKFRKCGEVEYLNKIGFLDLGERLILVHAIVLSKKEYKILKEKKNWVCLCPGSSARLGVGFHRLYNYDLNRILLGTDNAINNDTDSILITAWFLLNSQRALYKNGYKPTPEEIYKMLTFNPYKIISRAFGIKAGEIREGYVADVCIFDYKYVGFVYNPIWTLIHNPEWRPRFVFVNGRMVIEDYYPKVDFKGTWIHKRYGIRNYKTLKSYLFETFYDVILPEFQKEFLS